MPANCAEPGADVVFAAPFEVVLAELAALIADGVLRRASSPPGRLVKYAADLGTRGSPLEDGKAAERCQRPIFETARPPRLGVGARELLDHREGLHAVCKEVSTTVTVLCIAMRPRCRDGSKSGTTNASSRLS